MNVALPHLEAVAPKVAEQQSIQTASPALWQGAWVGWLTCQVVLLLLVESTSLAHQPGVAFSARVALVSGFVWAFARPCFSEPRSRGAFLLTTLSVEAGIGMYCGRLSSDSCWTLLTALALTAVLVQPPTRRCAHAVNRRRRQLAAL